MREFTSLLKVSPIDGTSPFEFMADHFEFTPTASDEEGGVSWNCDKTFVIDLPEKKAMQYFAIPRKAIITLTASDRSSFNIGTTDVPARVHITSHLQKAQLIVDCTMLTDPLA
mgnify:FL=1|jgi:hypothetical protein